MTKTIKKSLRSHGSVLRESALGWIDDDAMRMSASLAYYTVFSIGPLLILVVAIAGLVFGGEAVRGELYASLRGFLGPSGSKAVQDIVASSSQQKSGVMATIIGVIVLVIGATAVFGELQASLNKIWEAEGELKPKQVGVWPFVKTRLVSFAMVLTIGFLLLVSLVVNTILSAAFGYISRVLGDVAIGLEIGYAILSFVFISTLFALIFKILPDREIRWRDVWYGAIFTAFLFTVGKFLIGLYLGKTSVASSFGASASVVLIMLWAYYSAAIVFFGAEFTKAYARRHSIKSKPA